MLILIQSCKRDRDSGVQDASRDTWLKQWGHLVQHRYLCGDELGVPDSYDTLAWKVHAGMKVAIPTPGISNDIFYCDTDTYVCIPRLLTSDYRGWDYVGKRCDEGHASGGVGFYVSGRARDVLVFDSTPTAGYSDVWVGVNLGRAGITVHDDNRYTGDPVAWEPGVSISCHLGPSTGGFRPEIMHRFHQRVMREFGR